MYWSMANKKDDFGKALYVKVEQPLRGDLEELAKKEGTSAGALAKKIIKLYIREETYKKAQELLNIEDRVGTAVLLELQPKLDKLDSIEKEIMNLREEIQKLKESRTTAPKEKKKEEGEEKEIFNREEEEKRNKEEEKKERDKGEEKVKLRYPTFAGIEYEVKKNNVYYEDGSIWSMKLGAWLHRGKKIMEIKRKRDRELGR